MSIHTDIVTALASVASERVYPQIAPAEATYPLVNYRILNTDRTVTLHGAVACTEYQIVFECWAKTYAASISTADSVRAAVVASAALDHSYIDEPGEEFDASVDLFMTPVYFSFLVQ